MNNGTDPRRLALVAAGASVAVVAAALVVAHVFGLSSSGRLALAITAVIVSAGATAFVATRRSGSEEVRDLLRKIRPGPQSDDAFKDLSEAVDEMLLRLRQLEADAREPRGDTAIRGRQQSLEREWRRLLAAQEIARIGHWEWNSVEDKVAGSEELTRIYGLPAAGFPATLSAWMERLHPSESAKARIQREASAKSGGSFMREERIVRPDGTHRDLIVWGRALRDPQGKIVGLEGAAQDITEVRSAERELAARTRDLERSNADLEQFAYAASHDLQEPLRMVASYVQLLARRYRGKLDRDADEFIAFAVDGAERMQKLIRDLLTYSRVTRLAKPDEPVDLAQTLRTALTNLKVAIDDSGASVTAEPLPTVKGDATGLTALIQNLLANAIKFRGPSAPNIHVGVERSGNEWHLYVRDDGIGFDEKQAQRLFVIFQRLHTAEKYEGSGIGLAICRKIVERHGGRIWAEANAAGGATFHFTLPAAEPARNAETKVEHGAVS